MRNENLDKLVGDKLKDLNNTPKGIKWDINENWKKYTDTFNTKKRFLRIYKYAATIIILGISIYVINNQQKVKYTEIVTGDGEKATVKLSNGSIIWVNANSKVKYPERYTKKTLNISVEGEAYFEFNDKRDNPIIISAGNAVAQVIESSFNIRSMADENQIEITVTKGNVEIDSKGDNYTDAIEFSEGQKASIHKSNKLIFGGPNPDKNVIAWKTEHLSYTETQLYYITQKLEKLFDTNIEIKEDALKSCKISLNINADNIETILKEISVITNSEIQKDKTGFIINKGSCNTETKI